MEVNKEIEEMLNALGDPTPKDAEAEVEVEEEEEKEETKEEKPEEKEKGEEKETEEKKDDEVKEKEGEKEEEPPEDKDAIIEHLRQQLNGPHIPPVAELKEEKKEEKKEEPLKLDEHDFVGELDLDDLVRDKGMFNKLLNAVYSKGVNDSKKMATEGVLLTIPDMVKHNFTLMETLTKARDKFYDENKDLAPFKAVVAVVFEEVAAKNADKKIGEIMDLVAPEVRHRLQLKKSAIKTEKTEDAERKEKGDERTAPRLHGTKGGNQRGNQRERPNTSGIAGEIAAMNKALGN